MQAVIYFSFVPLKNISMLINGNDSASPSEGLLGDRCSTESVLPSVNITTEGIGATTKLAEGNVEGGSIS
jgi:hypothetical protein